MAQQQINPGSAPVLWSDIASAYNTINDNFTELYASIGGDSVDFTSLGTSLIPRDTEVFDLGSSTKKWRDLWLSGSSIYLGDAVITSTGTTVNLPIGSTIGGLRVDENYFKFIAVDGQDNIEADEGTDTLTIAAGNSGIELTTDVNTDTLTITNSGVTSLSGASGQIGVSQSTGAVVLTNLGVISATAGQGIELDQTTGDITITNSGVVDLDAGIGIQLSARDPLTGVITITNSQPNIPQQTFSIIDVPGQTPIAADSTADTLTIESGGNGISILTSPLTDTLTITIPPDGTMELADLTLSGTLNATVAVFNDNLYGGARDRLWLGGGDTEGTPNINIPNEAEGTVHPISVSNQIGGGIELSAYGATNDYVSSVFVGDDFSVDTDNSSMILEGTGAWRIGSSNFSHNVEAIDPENDPGIGITVNEDLWIFNNKLSKVSSGDLVLSVDSGDSTVYDWNLGTDGTTNLPGSIVLPNGTTIGVNQTNNTTISTDGSDRTAYTDTLIGGSAPSWLTTAAFDPEQQPNLTYGWEESAGLWFTGNNVEGVGSGYPIITDFTIAHTQRVQVDFTFLYNEGCADHGICVFLDGEDPSWVWDPDTTRIAAQWDCGSPIIYGQTTATSLGDPILEVGTAYRARFIYDHESTPAVTLITMTMDETVLETITLSETLPTGSYRIGFSADQDDGVTRSYFSDLTITTGAASTEWTFTNDGRLIFPDGTEQTTAYTANPGSPLWAVINVSGEVSFSEDAITWTAGQKVEIDGTPIDGGSYRITVGPENIVYIIGYGPGSDLYYGAGMSYALTKASYTIPSEADSGLDGYFDFRDIEYGGGYYIAVGEFTSLDPGGDIVIPVMYYSSDGINWTQGAVDAAYVSGVGGNLRGVDYDGTGWLILGLPGAFYITSPTEQLAEGNFTSIVPGGVGSPDRVIYTGDRWVMRDGDIVYFAPTAGPLTDFWTDFDTSELQLTEFGMARSAEDDSFFGGLSEIAGGVIDGESWFMTGTQDGQILATKDGGSNWVASVPQPHTGTVLTVTSDSTSTIITIDWNQDQLEHGQRIAITGATGATQLNASFYVESTPDGPNTWILWQNYDFTGAVDSSLWAGSYDNGSATITFYSGTYFDGLGYGGGKFIAANDDDQLFSSTDAETWTKVNDQSNAFEYWDDVDYYATFGSSIATPSNKLVSGSVQVSLASTGTLTLPGALILPTAYPADGSIGNATALSLSKQVQILDSANDGLYSLADGREGQIMYFVPATNTAFRAITVSVANARTTTGVDNIPEINNINWLPFWEPALYDGAPDATLRSQTSTIAMAIFTDNAWNLQGGYWD